MSDATIDRHTSTFDCTLTTQADDLLGRVDAEDQTLDIAVQENIIIDGGGATPTYPTLRLKTGAGGLELNSRDEVLRLQAAINRAVAQWRESAASLP